MATDLTPKLMLQLSKHFAMADTVIEYKSGKYYRPHLWFYDGGTKTLARNTAKAWVDRGWAQHVRDEQGPDYAGTLTLTEEGRDIVSAFIEENQET